MQRVEHGVFSSTITYLDEGHDGRQNASVMPGRSAAGASLVFGSCSCSCRTLCGGHVAYYGLRGLQARLCCSTWGADSLVDLRCLLCVSILP